MKRYLTSQGSTVRRPRALMTSSAYVQLAALLSRMAGIKAALDGHGESGIVIGPPKGTPMAG